MNLKKIKICLKNQLERLKPKLEHIALEMARNPEPAFKEYRASSLLKELLASEGFEIEERVAGLETSFRAYSKVGKNEPSIGFLAEMDALKGLGHACGHNLIAGASAGAGIILRKAFPRMKGGIEVFGCPAEEEGGGKVIMDNSGVFSHLDAVFLVHPSNKTEIYKPSLALVEVKMLFLGRSAHASSEPEKGVNALEALIQTFNSINGLRVHLPKSAKVNGIITEGGVAPNIIPERASGIFWVRGKDLKEALEVARLVVYCGKCSASAQRAKFKAELDKDSAYAPFVPNRGLGEEMVKILDELGIKIDESREDEALGSTDFGNLSWKVAAIHPTIKIPGCDAVPHTREFENFAKSPSGMKMMFDSALAMALLGYRVMTDSGLRKRMKKELSLLKGGEGC